MKILIIAMTALILSSCSSVHYNRADVLDRQNNIKTLQQRLDAATEANVDILAPESFQKAADHLRDAYKEAQKINDRNAGDKTAEEGLALLEKAESIANRSRSVLTEALEKRSQAKAAEAHLAFKSEFVNLDRELKQAGKAIEAGKKIEGLKENASLASSYAALELRALKVTVSDKAERAYENALKSNAQRLAPLPRGDARPVRHLPPRRPTSGGPRRCAGRHAGGAGRDRGRLRGPAGPRGARCLLRIGGLVRRGARPLDLGHRAVDHLTVGSGAAGTRGRRAALVLGRATPRDEERAPDHHGGEQQAGADHDRR